MKKETKKKIIEILDLSPERFHGKKRILFTVGFILFLFVQSILMWYIAVRHTSFLALAVIMGYIAVLIAVVILVREKIR